MLSLEVFKTRRCTTCTDKDKLKYGCEKDIKPFKFDNELITRCPLHPFKENPREYSEYFQMYSYREKNIPAEAGGYWDQPAVYLDIMSEIETASSDAQNPEFVKNVYKDEDNKLDALMGVVGVPITRKS